MRFRAALATLLVLTLFASVGVASEALASRSRAEYWRRHAGRLEGVILERETALHIHRAPLNLKDRLDRRSRIAELADL